MAQFVFLGLGNPGDQYADTRHNAGWLALDTLIRLWQDDSIPLDWRYEKKIRADVLKLVHGDNEIFFVKPDTYMNESGDAAVAAVKWFLDIDPSQTTEVKLPQLVVFHDDLDLETGTYKLQFGSGPKVHNGVNDVRVKLQSTQFWTARIGIDSRKGDRRMPGKAYVLQRWPQEERQHAQSALSLLAEELPYVVLQ